MHTWGKDLIFRPRAEEKCTISPHTLKSLWISFILLASQKKPHITWFSPKPILGKQFHHSWPHFTSNWLLRWVPGMKFEKKKRKKSQIDAAFQLHSIFIIFSRPFREYSHHRNLLRIRWEKKKLFLNLITGSICAGESQPPVFPIQLHADVVSGGLDQRRIEMA